MFKQLLNYDLAYVSHSKLKAKVQSYFECELLDDVISLIKNNMCDIFVGRMSKMLFAFDYKNINIIKYLGKHIEIKNDLLIVESGISLFELGKFAIKNGIDGFEKIMTIPGNLGGSVVNNVSFLDQEISKNILFLEIIDKDGNIRLIKRDEIIFEYRKMSINLKKYFIAKVIFKIHKKLRHFLYREYKKAINYRMENQPKIHSFGSTFINPYPLKAYQLINQCIDCKEFNKVTINLKHANFIELRKDLEYLNLVKLIERIQEVVYNKVGLYLKTEIKIIY